LLTKENQSTFEHDFLFDGKGENPSLLLLPLYPRMLRLDPVRVISVGISSLSNEISALIKDNEVGQSLLIR
jgi:hypothetical protein